MRTKRAAMRQFIADDSDTDYIETGEHKVRSGKGKFMKLREEAGYWTQKASNEFKNVRDYVDRNRAVLENELRGAGELAIPVELQGKPEFEARFVMSKLEGAARKKMAADGSYGKLEVTALYDGIRAKAARTLKRQSDHMAKYATDSEAFKNVVEQGMKVDAEDIVEGLEKASQ